MEEALVDAMIAEKEERVSALMAEIAQLQAAIAALLELQERSRTTRVQDASVQLRGAATMSVSGTVKRPRPLKPTWAKILRFIGKRGQASLDDIMDLSDQKGLGINRNTLRSQVSIYTEQGWLARVSVGVFRLTDEGAEKCRLNKDEPPDDDASGGFSGGVAERSNAPDSKSGGVPAHHGDQSPAGSNPAASAHLRRDLLSSAALPPVFTGRKIGVGAPTLPFRNPQTRS